MLVNHDLRFGKIFVNESKIGPANLAILKKGSPPGPAKLEKMGDRCQKVPGFPGGPHPCLPPKGGPLSVRSPETPPPEPVRALPLPPISPGKWLSVERRRRMLCKGSSRRGSPPRVAAANTMQTAYLTTSPSSLTIFLYKMDRVGSRNGPVPL